ncbi:peptidoglycan-binding domain-containing protein [Falsigemmobacter faecalis]|uniref:Peptidoglycan-binding protein n=1 Tax=Falsigemmobacter faecalis TaxID=2488730 RepID=A0A3P3DSI7_9RHOB|nr:peptidoglycan-binding domain-containing protein [Falsigemmobacter faecalis]RRH77237.1 peptidoglycan-binding protein [Falsigemmobacter faecalis]
MKRIALPLLVMAGLGAPLTAAAQDGIGDVIGGVARAMITQELDRNAFVQAQSRNTAAAYENYLGSFPQGAFRQDAIAALNALRPGAGQPVIPQPGATPAANTEAALGLSRARRVEIQQQLTALGFNTYGADGAWGNNTRLAIRGWQRANRFAETGYVTAQDVALISSQYSDLGRGPVTPAPSVNTPAAQEAALGLTRNQRLEIQQQLTALGHDTRGADGAWGNNTRLAIRSWQRSNRLSETGYVTAQDVALLSRQYGDLRRPGATPPPVTNAADEAAERALGLSVSERREVQLRLTVLGHDTQGTAGTFDRRTRQALRAWQRSQGSPESGYLNSDQLRALQRQTGG